MPEPTPPFKSVGEFIRTQRELMSLSMRQLAGLAKVSNPYLSQIERGVYTPSAQVLKASPMHSTCQPKLCTERPACSMTRWNAPA